MDSLLILMLPSMVSPQDFVPAASLGKLIPQYLRDYFLPHREVGCVLFYPVISFLEKLINIDLFPAYLSH